MRRNRICSNASPLRLLQKKQPHSYLNYCSLLKVKTCTSSYFFALAHSNCAAAAMLSLHNLKEGNQVTNPSPAALDGAGWKLDDIF